MAETSVRCPDRVFQDQCPVAENGRRLCRAQDAHVGLHTRDGDGVDILVVQESCKLGLVEGAERVLVDDALALARLAFGRDGRDRIDEVATPRPGLAREVTARWVA